MEKLDKREQEFIVKLHALLEEYQVDICADMEGGDNHGVELNLEIIFKRKQGRWNWLQEYKNIVFPFTARLGQLELREYIHGD